MSTEGSHHPLLRNLPHAPGVYLMKDSAGSVRYVGKATDLRDRVRSYFGGSDSRAFVRLLDTWLDTVDFIVTASPKEALLLENTLIKKLKPRFNVQLRDDKNYVSLRIDPRHPWPRVEVVRRRPDDGAWYFGPYASASKLRDTLRLLHRFFQLRTCRDSVLFNRNRPCLQYQIGRCPAPCVDYIDKDTYRSHVDEARLFLQGRSDLLRDTLDRRMLEAAESLAFEEAARLRDQIQALDASLTPQAAITQHHDDLDAIGVARQDELVSFVLLEVRGGSIQALRTFPCFASELDEGLLLSDLLSRLYGDESTPPATLLLPSLPDNLDALQAAFDALADRRVRFLVPKRGERHKLLALAEHNAQAQLDGELQRRSTEELALRALQRRLHLTRQPRTIECYDISNLQNQHVVAARVRFTCGRPDPDGTRRYRVRTTGGQDDFGALREVMIRRAHQHRSNEEPLPDLIVIDGGKGQLAAALDGLRSVHPDYASAVTVVGLAKARTTGRDADDRSTRSTERLFLPGVKDPLPLRAHTPERYLLERLRDETHRSAIQYHRKVRGRAVLRSALEDIPGVGPARRHTLLRHFGSLQALRDASLKELEAAPGLSAPLAYAIFEHFHPGEADPPPGEQT